jgi:hypothetical protein
MSSKLPEQVVSPERRSLEHLSRPEVIDRLRAVLVRLAGEGQCVCSAVGQLGIFCQGFNRYTDPELREQLDWIVRKRAGASRETLESVAALYHLGRLEATGKEICCDVETRDHVVCDGWNSFDNSALERFHLAMVGQPVKID